MQKFFSKLILILFFIFQFLLWIKSGRDMLAFNLKI